MQLFLPSFPGDKLVSHGEDGEAIKKTFLQGLDFQDTDISDLQFHMKLAGLAR